jgi:hypothetical protein
MIGMVVNSYEGLLSLVFQPLMATVVSGLFVGLALLIGLLLKVPAISRVWSASRLVPALTGLACVVVLTVGHRFGLIYVASHPETGQSITMLHPVAAVGAYFGLVFVVANWPRIQRYA